jgi:hypothetical protein
MEAMAFSAAIHTLEIERFEELGGFEMVDFPLCDSREARVFSQSKA